MTDYLKCVSPVDGSVYVDRPLASGNDIDKALARAREARESWGRTPVKERCALLEKAVDAFVAGKSAIAEEIRFKNQFVAFGFLPIYSVDQVAGRVNQA